MPEQVSEAHWNEEAKAILGGLIMFCVCREEKNRRALATVREYLTLASERKEDAVAFLNEAVAWYRKLEIGIERVMTDNGSCYKSHAFRAACKALGLRHIRTRPYTNGPSR